jgi:hypothetical protein
MTLCPVAIAITCRKCPVVGFCPVKEIIGDYKPEEANQAAGNKSPAAGKPEHKK